MVGIVAGIPMKRRKLSMLDCRCRKINILLKIVEDFLLYHKFYILPVDVELVEQMQISCSKSH